MLNVFKINYFFEEHEFKESNFRWNTDRYLKVLIGNTVDLRSLGVPICPFYPYTSTPFGDPTFSNPNFAARLKFVVIEKPLLRCHYTGRILPIGYTCSVLLPRGGARVNR